MEKKDVDKRGGNKRINYARAFGFFLVTREGRGGGGGGGRRGRVHCRITFQSLKQLSTLIGRRPYFECMQN